MACPLSTHGVAQAVQATAETCKLPTQVPQFSRKASSVKQRCVKSTSLMSAFAGHLRPKSIHVSAFPPTTSAEFVRFVAFNSMRIF